MRFLLHMTKSSAKKIEKDEKKIIEELSKNANKSINDIAKSCGFSRQKVWRVIKNLEKNHTIWGYTAVIDNEKLNKKNYMMLIKRTNKPLSNKLIEDIINRNVPKEIKKYGINMTCSFYTHGIYDWIICFNAPGTKEAKLFVEYYNKLYGEFLSEINLVDVMFSVGRCGVINPEIKKFKDFFKT